MRQCTDRDDVDAGFGDGAHGFEIDPARGFQDRLAGRQLYGFGVHVEREVVEQQDVRLERQGFLELGDRIDFDFDLHCMPDPGLGAFHRGRYATADSDVIVLDQDGVVEAVAMVMAAAALDRVLLQGAQVRQGLARAGDLGRQTVDGRDIFRRQGGNAGQVAQQVERDAFGGQDGARLAFDPSQDVARFDLTAVGQDGFEAHLMVHHFHGQTGAVDPGGNAGFTGAEFGLETRLGLNDGRSGHVAGQAQIFLERVTDDGIDQQVRQSGDVHAISPVAS